MPVIRTNYYPNFIIQLAFEPHLNCFKSLIHNATEDKCKAIAEFVQIQPYWNIQEIDAIASQLNTHPRQTILNNANLIQQTLRAFLLDIVAMANIEDIVENGPSF